MSDSSKIDLELLEAVEEQEQEKHQAPTTADPQLERTIVAVSLRSEWADGIASACLSAADFTNVACRTVWKAKASLKDRGVDHNPVTLLSEITAVSSLKAVGGEEGLKSFYGDSGDEKEIASYCEQLRNFTIARAQAKAGRELQQWARKPMAAMERIEKTQTVLSGILTSGTGRSTMESPEAAMARIGCEKLMNPALDANYLTTGWGPLDRVIVGIAPGTFNVIGARPGGGKSAFASAIALHVAQTLKKRVAIFSLEMSTRAVLARMACSIAQVDNEQYRKGNLDDASMDRLSSAFLTLEGLPLYINERRGRTPAEIEQELYALIAKDEKPELAIIDHLQKMKVQGRFKDMREMYTSIVDDATDLGKRLGIPFIVLSQFTKIGKKSHERPVSADLRETGNIDDNADLIMLLHSPHRWKSGATPEERRRMECIVAKQRDGRESICEFDFYGEYFRFLPIDREVSW